LGGEVAELVSLTPDFQSSNAWPKKKFTHRRKTGKIRLDHEIVETQ